MKLRLLALAAAGLAAAALHPQAASAEDPINIGVIANLTGSDVKSSVDMVRGVELAAATINAAPLTTKAGFLRGLKDYDHYQTLSSITAKTTIISGGVDKLTPPCHARELAHGIPGATLIHRPTAGHGLLHEVPQVVTGAISSTIAADGPVVTPSSATSEKPRGGEFRVRHRDLTLMASPVKREERVS